MHPAKQIITAPSAEPVSLSDAKLHLRVDHDADDALITSLIKASREWVENYTGRALITQQWRILFDKFPCNAITIPLPPLKTVDAIKYLDSVGNEQTLATTEYKVDTASEPGIVYLAYGKSWPSTLAEPRAVKVEITCGWTPADVPQAIKQAMFLLIGHWYDTREAVGQNPGGPIQFTVESLLGPYRDMRF